MKRKLALALALILLLGVMLAPSALAVDRYALGVTITDSTGAHTVAGTSGYLSLTGDSLTAAVAGVVAEKRDELRVFGSPAMRAIVDAGLQAQRAGKSAWDSWVASYETIVENVNQAAQDLNVKGLLADFDAKADALTVGTEYTISYTPTGTDSADPAHGETYTVSITLRRYDSGDAARITLAESANGSAEAPASAFPGQTVTVTVRGDEGWVTADLRVAAADGKRIDAVYQGEGRYAFVMPDGPVTVTPRFRRALTAPDANGVSAQLNTDEHVVFMVGDDQGLFRPNASVTRAEVAQMFSRLLREKPETVTVAFVDVDDGAWYADAVRTLATLGILNGVGEGRFEPARAITRAEFAAICARFAEGEGSAAFPDVPETHWAAAEIAKAASFGWIIGDELGRFNPDAPITRAEAAAVINRMLGRLGDYAAIDSGSARSFPDVSESFWGYYDIAEATSGHDFVFGKENLHEEWKSA